MINNILKKESGVSLVSLAVAVIILVIVTNMLIYNAKDGVQIKNLKSMYNDIENLRDKVSEYYIKYGTIPANTKLEFTNTSSMEPVISKIADTGKFYIVELSNLENLTLTYGEDYKKINSESTQTDINNLTDIYIINSVSQNVFYVKGINVDGVMYYTDYTKDEVDVKAVNNRYYDGVKIPEECSYVTGSKKSNDLEIKDSNNVHYTWVTVERGLAEMPSGTNITVDKEEEFLESVDTYGGYWKHSDTELKYIVVVDEYWSKAYDKAGTYTDTNGDSAYIPKGFKVSTKYGLNKVNNGLVVKDENDNEYVWISVPKSITIDCGPEEIEDALKEYAKDYRADGYEDVWYQGCGIANKEEYNKLKQRMLESIQEKGGFYIARYEAGLGENQSSKTGGLASKTVETLKSENGLPVSQQDRYVYNYVTVGQAQGLANALTTDEYDCSLMFGIQWDLVCKFIETSGAKTKDEISVDSSSWGNYVNTTFNLKRGKYSTDKGAIYKDATNTTNDSKRANQETLLTTGITRRNASLNIYDLAGNMWESTIEKANSDHVSSIKGASLHEGKRAIAIHFSTTASYCDYHIGFRVTIY